MHSGKRRLLLLPILVLCLLFPARLDAASRYWVGGGSSPNWSATGNTNWGSASNTQDNASVPGSTDDVFFDGVGVGNSASTISANITVKSLDMTGYANTLTHNSGVTLTIAGAGVTFKMVSGMTYTKGSTSTSAISFTGTSGNTSVTTGGKVLGNVTFNGVGGTWTLQDNLTANGSSATVLTVTNGTVDFNGKTVSIGQFSSANSNTRTITCGAATFNFVAQNFGTYWDTNNVTGLTFSGASATWNIPNGTDNNFLTGGLTYGTIVINVAAANFSFTGSATWTSITWHPTATTTFKFAAGSTTTITTTFDVDGNSGHLLTLDTLTGASTFTLTKSGGGTMCLTDYLTLTRSTGSPGSTWSAGANSTDGGSNSGWTFAACGAGTTTKKIMMMGVGI